MNKLNQQDIIQHYLLNLFTILNVELSDLKIDDKRKEKVTNLINTASVIVANEKVFFNEKVELFIQEISLTDIVDITCSIFSKTIKTNKIEILPFKKTYLIKVDKYYFNEAFKYLLENIIKDANKIEFIFDEDKKIFKIKHNKKTSFTEPFKDFSNFLRTKNLTKEDITFQLALAIFKMHKIEIKFDENEIKIKF